MYKLPSDSIFFFSFLLDSFLKIGIESKNLVMISFLSGKSSNAEILLFDQKQPKQELNFHLSFVRYEDRFQQKCGSYSQTVQEGFDPQYQALRIWKQRHHYNSQTHVIFAHLIDPFDSMS